MEEKLLRVLKDLYLQIVKSNFVDSNGHEAINLQALQDASKIIYEVERKLSIEN